MTILITWLIGTIFLAVYLGGMGIDLFKDAYDSGNFVKFIVSLVCFIAIPGLSYIFFLILIWIKESDENNERKKEEENEKQRRLIEKRERKYRLRKEAREQKNNNPEK